jgi:hypothetical protein
VSTVVFNRVLVQQAAKEGVKLDNDSVTDAPRKAQLDAYEAAQWTGFAFGMIGGCFVDSCSISFSISLLSYRMTLWL